MSADSVKGTAEIEFKKDRFSNPVNSAKKDVERLGKSGKDAMSNLSRGSQKASKGLDDVKQSGAKAERAIDQVGQKAEETERDMLALGVSVIGFGQAIGGVTDQIFAFDEKMIALERSSFGLAQTTEDLKRSEEDLRIALDEGNLSALELQRTIKDLTLLRRDHAIEVKEVAAEEKALKGELVNFGLSLAQTGFFGFTFFNQVLSLHQKQWIAAKLAQIGFSKATIATAFSMKGLRTAMTLVSSHPLMTVAIAAAAAAMAAWETNAFGLRDTFSKLAGVELPSISEGIGQLTGQLLPEAQSETTELDLLIQEAEKDLAALKEGTDETADSMGEYADKTRDAASATRDLTSSKSIIDWVSYWDKKKKAVMEATQGLALFNAEVRRTKQSGFSTADVKSIGRGTFGSIVSTASQNLDNQISITQARLIALRNTIVALNQMGISGGNAVTLANQIGLRNISGSNQKLVSAVLSGDFDSFGKEGTGFAAAFGGSPATSVFGSTAAFSPIHGLTNTAGGVSVGGFGGGFGNLTRAKGPRRGRNRNPFGRGFRHDARRDFRQEVLPFLEALNLGNVNDIEALTGLDVFAGFAERGTAAGSVPSNAPAEVREQIRMFMNNRLQELLQRTRDNRREVNRRVSLVKSISALNPTLVSKSSLRTDSASLEEILANERARIDSLENILGISETDVIDLNQTKSGRFDLENMVSFQERIKMEQNTIGI